MTGVLLDPGTLEQQIPDLLSGHAVVALVPATDRREWSAEIAWRIAGATAARGRVTALVDCFVDAPVLHTVAGASNDEGIVDAFEYGASLNRIVQEQPQANLYFIPTGTFSPDPAPLLTHPRWRRLSAGFRHEEALLLLFVPPDHLEGVAADPDGLIVLAPQGKGLAIAEAPGVAQAMGRGLPLLAVVGEGSVETETAAERRQSSSITTPVVLHRPRRPPWVRYAGLLLAVIAAGGYLYRSELLELAGLGLEPPPLPARHVPHHPPPHPVDSLPYAIQVSAWPSLGDAVARADTLESRGFHAIVTPIRIGPAAWYRVQAGPATSVAAADSVLAALRAAGLLPANQGSVAAVPLSVALQGGLKLDSARALRGLLRRAGVPAFLLGQADQKYRILVGAFGAAPQAALIQSLLTPTGSAGDIVPRVGFLP